MRITDIKEKKTIEIPEDELKHEKTEESVSIKVGEFMCEVVIDRAKWKKRTIIITTFRVVKDGEIIHEDIMGWLL